MKPQPEKDLSGVTTPGDIAILYSQAKKARQKPAEYIAHYLWISTKDAEKLIKKAKNQGLIE